jgi:hypothetical protein
MLERYGQGEFGGGEGDVAKREGNKRQEKPGDGKTGNHRDRKRDGFPVL